MSDKDHPLEARIGESMLILCGPSGAGKSTLVRDLLSRHPSATVSISYTTRAPRGEEEDGVHYHFVDKPRFEAMISEDAFAEWAEVHGNLYGTTRATLAKAAAADREVLFDIDFQGAQQLKEAYTSAWAVLISPPSIEVLTQRLRGRGTDSEESIQKRLGKALEELRQGALFDFVLVNDSLEEAQQALSGIYASLRHRRHRGAARSGGLVE